MTKNTFPVNGGALPKIDRAALMRRPWAIFRETYLYPRIQFADIGRKCFAWALRKAWAEAREAARLAAMTPKAKADRVDLLQGRPRLLHRSRPDVARDRYRVPRRNSPTAGLGQKAG